MLKEKLDAMVEKSKSKITPEIGSVISASTKAVADSIASRSIPVVGQPMPEFELVDSVGQLVKSSDITSDGQLVLTFFRGGW